MTYSLFIDEWNRPPDAWDHNWIIARSIDDAIQTAGRLSPDLIVFGNSYFEREFVEWMTEHDIKSPVEFLMGQDEVYEWRLPIKARNNQGR